MQTDKISAITLMLGCLLTTNKCMHAESNTIRLNQVGFYPEGPKYAVAISSASNRFYITTPDLADTLYSGSPDAAETWSHSGETVQLIDFSIFETAGEYRIVVPDLGQSYIFRIDDYIHQDLTKAALKGFYFQRASLALDHSRAGQWQRPAGHPDTLVYIHPSAASESRPANTVISAPRGWYDAGDYNKYIINSGISTYQILALYEHFADYYQEFDIGIPESGDEIPDILNEALWNLRWMLTMQDPEDGGVYHKLTHANFSGAVMPHQATLPRYVVQKSTSAALDFAAVMAQAGRIFDDFSTELPGLADSCLSAALRAWNWARKNPSVFYNQNTINNNYDPDINTGAYGDWSFTDEFQWAAAELFITTGADSFLTAHDPLAGSFGIPWWGGVNTLGLYSLAFHRASIGEIVDTGTVVTKILNLTEGLRDTIGASAYHVVMGESGNNFGWGSNGTAANQGMALIQAYCLTRDESYLEAALQNLDYILGRNATGYCFVTGIGSRSPLHIHHRPSQADGITNPVPGLLAGGPNPNQEDGCPGYIGDEAARSYVDSWCSYASNEIAINWNAPLVYLIGAIEALYSLSGKPNPTAIRNHDEWRDPLFAQFAVAQNYPNPFNPSTLIKYTLADRAAVQLGVYNLTGQRVRTLQNRTLPAGDYNLVWNGETDTGEKVCSGVYIIHLVAQHRDRMVSDSRKILMLK